MSHPPHRRRPARRGALTALTAALAAMVLAAGCASEGQRPGTNASGGLSLEDLAQTPEARLGFRLQWRGYPQVGERIRFFNAYNDIIVVQDERNILTVMNANTGSNRFAIDLGADLKKFVGNVRYDGQLLCSSESEIQFIDERTGGLTQRQRLSLLANTTPAVWGSIAVYGSAKGEVLGHNLANGFKAWGYQLDGRITADPVLMGASVGVVSQGGDVLIVDPRTGRSGGRRQRIYAGLDNNPVANDRAMYIAGLDQSVRAYSANSGREIWRRRSEYPLTAQPSLHEDRLYVTIPQTGLVALDAGTGTEIWANPDLGGTVIGSRDGRLLQWDGRRVRLLGRERGDVIETVEFPGARRLVMDAFEDGNLYVILATGEVTKYSPRF